MDTPSTEPTKRRTNGTRKYKKRLKGQYRLTAGMVKTPYSDADAARAVARILRGNPHAFFES